MWGIPWVVQDLLVLQELLFFVVLVAEIPNEDGRGCWSQNKVNNLLIYFDANYVATTESRSSSSEYLNFCCLEKALNLL